ncbi:MAG: phytoene/squalene synthase family protein [Planctomycetota bacterium]|jgi:phytoene/squalene synthetase
MTISPVQQLDVYGPQRCETLTVEQARKWCRRLVRNRYENFSVLSRLMPVELRDDYAALYAFCRWADDLGDEVGDPDRSLELLAWWRRELQQCVAGEPRHPVFIALAPTIERHDLSVEPFDNLIKAFERLVLMIGGEPRRDDLFELSDAICTALQLTNHWQDVRRDILERDRIYIPREMNDIERFEDRLLTTARQGYAPDQQFFGESRLLVGACVDRTWPLFEKGAGLLPRLSPQTRPFVWLFLAGGLRVLRAIEAWNCETVLYRPRLSMVTKLALVARAWLGSKLRREAST